MKKILKIIFLKNDYGFINLFSKIFNIKIPKVIPENIEDENKKIIIFDENNVFVTFQKSYGKNQSLLKIKINSEQTSLQNGCLMQYEDPTFDFDNIEDEVRYWKIDIFLNISFINQNFYIHFFNQSENLNILLEFMNSLNTKYILLEDLKDLKFNEESNIIILRNLNLKDYKKFERTKSIITIGEKPNWQIHSIFI